MTDWKLKRTRVLGITFEDEVFSPIYHGENFERACALAEKNRAAVWEDDRTRAIWIVSHEQPPFALKKPDAPRDPQWTLVGDAR
jgi:hypothetical protein